MGKTRHIRHTSENHDPRRRHGIGLLSGRSETPNESDSVNHMHLVSLSPRKSHGDDIESYGTLGGDGSQGAHGSQSPKTMIRADGHVPLSASVTPAVNVCTVALTLRILRSPCFRRAFRRYLDFGGKRCAWLRSRGCWHPGQISEPHRSDGLIL